VLGHSERGRAIRVQRYGDFSSPRTILAVGCIHGNECEGVEITRRLAQGPHPAELDLWIVHSLNPDGRRLGLRVNGRGVDLNRNFGSEWRESGRRWDPEYSGPRPWSERETRLARRLVLRAGPDVTIWYHQPQNVVRAWGGSRATGRRYARLAGEEYRSIRWPNGTAPNWQNHRFPGAASFVVELPAGSLPDGGAARHARAVRRLLPLPNTGPDDFEAIAPDRPSASNPRSAAPGPAPCRRGSGPAARPRRRRARRPPRPAEVARSKR
jgi:murein peptide amidase A